MASPDNATHAPAAAPGPRWAEDLAVLEFRGDDADKWLSGQVTNDITKNDGKNATYALFVTVRGKIMADAWLVRADDGAWRAAVPRASLPALRESFDKYIIMEDVTVTDEEGRVLSIPQSGAPAALAALTARLPHWHVLRHGDAMTDILVPESEVATVSALAPIAKDLNAHDELRRIQRATPRYGVDFGDKHYPQEAGLKDRAVSFNKGCYLGQEVVCTLESRGHIVKQLMLLRGAGPLPAPGTAITAEGGAEIGSITSAVTDSDGRVIALGYVKRAYAKEGTAVTAGGATLTVTEAAR